MWYFICCYENDLYLYVKIEYEKIPDVEKRACRGADYGGWYCRNGKVICGDDCDKKYNTTRNCGHKMSFC